MFFHNPEHNFIYVYTPLCVSAVPDNIRHYILGSKGVELNQYKDKHNILPNMCYSLDIKHMIGEKEWKKNYTFGVVRNPFDYVIAMFEYFTEGSYEKIAWCRGLKEPKEAIKEQYRLKSRGFEQWLLQDKDYDYLHAMPFCGYRLTSQLVWLSEVDDVFSYEESTPMLNSLFAKTKTTLPSFRGGPDKKELKRKRASYFGSNKKLIDLVADSFKDEIEMFNFTVE